MEIDFSSVWSWTLPLWALVVIVSFLGGVLIQHPQIVPITFRETVKSSNIITAPSAPSVNLAAMPPLPLPLFKK